MADRYKTDQDVILRLHETIIRYRGGCFLARSTGADLLIDLFHPSKGFNERKHRVSGNDPELDISSVSVGLLQFRPDTVLLIARGPFRKQKQGLSVENLLYKTLGSKKSYFSNMQTSMVCSKTFFDMLEENYPNYTAAHERVRSVSEPAIQVAFSKKLAMTYEKGADQMYLYLNDTIISSKKPEETHWHIDEGYNNTTTAMYLVSNGVPIY